MNYKQLNLLVYKNHVFDLNTQILLDNHIKNILNIDSFDDEILLNNILNLKNKEDIMFFIYVLIRPKILMNSEKEITEYNNRIHYNLDKLIELFFNKVIFNSIDELQNIFLVNYNYYHVYNGLNNKLLYQKITKLFKLLCNDLFIIHNYNKNNKKKIGFMSSYLFKNHSVCRDRIGIVRAMIQSEQYEIYLFTYDNIEEGIYNSIINSLNFKNKIILPLKLSEARNMILSYNLDMIIYPEIGMDVYFYLLSYSKLAPIQINTWGHSETSGIDTIDYYFSSKYYETETSQDNYSEKLICLDSLGTYYYDISIFEYYKDVINTNINDIYELFNLSSKCNIYGVLQPIYKFHPTNIKIIKNILENDTKALVIFISSNGLEKRFLKYLDDHLDFYNNRVRIIERQTTKNYLKLIRIMNIILDTYPFGGCNTSLECLFLGKVLITLPSNKINGRFTYGFYKKMNIDELICNNNIEFINKSLYYANNIDERNIISEKILKNLKMLFYEKNSIITWINYINELLSN
jgi:predicted O-linked N-acetylglucosamine transferase (SPINDLY family)